MTEAFQIAYPDPEVPFTIGRKQENSLCIQDMLVSRQHAVIEYREGKWFLKNLTQNSITELNDAPIDEAEINDGDVIHIGPHQLRAIMKLIIEDGKGIELNTSSFKYGSSTWLPRIEVLKAYKELGGEILTVGSDTHETEHFMDHFDEAESLLTSLGFKYYCTFKDRKPTFHKFD